MGVGHEGRGIRVDFAGERCREFRRVEEQEPVDRRADRLIRAMRSHLPKLDSSGTLIQSQP
jgi:hypothetical protein